ncbi:HAD-IA family hydrolase [Winogradskyella aquimaris]|uniref:HAD-IA family hydrolase n=1 Tax=Winogradskyella aquimaris TaxID=864074 RepID=A0ABU5EMJ4_9FLAO|nr:HAD-IA family hydrolase [Winogradskyella aquimaris]MDY2587676.1 HAD-IA family hydrolase [Winogradskyella aquimaris]
MIDTLIFDFGDVFINLDKQGAMQNALNLFKMETFEKDMITTNMLYEVGKITTEEFIEFYKLKFPYLEDQQIVKAWNYILRDFPKYRLEFLQKIAQENRYKIILLSNTNDMHIDYIKSNISFYEEFKGCFDAFYLSQEIQLRKPNQEVFDFVLENNNLNPEHCFFVDDTKENTDMAESLGIKVWNIDETREDVIDLFNLKNIYF